jgi:small subunit ribosomal protein S3
LGQKIHPVGLRVGVIRGFDSQWYYGKKGYGAALLQDDRIRRFIKRRTGLGNVSRVEIERAANRVKVTIFTARPGAIIGRGGKGIDELTDTLNRLVRLADNGRGIKIQVSGRLGGSEIARREGDKIGKIPLHTIRADIDYGQATAHTVYGSVGCKVWIYKGEVLPERRLRDQEPQVQQPRRGRAQRDEAAAQAFASVNAAAEVNTTGAEA